MGLFDDSVDGVCMEGAMAFEDEEVVDTSVDGDEGATDEEMGDEEMGENDVEKLAEEADAIFEDDDMVEDEIEATGDETEKTVGGDGYDEQMNPAATAEISGGEEAQSEPSSEPAEEPVKPDNFDPEKDV